MELTKTVDSLADRLAPYAWRDDENSIRNKAGGNCYEWHASLTARFRPQVVVEIGVQRGYSAIAMLMGYPGIRSMYLFDNEADGYRLSEAMERIGRAREAVCSVTEIYARTLDTQTVEGLPVPMLVDLAHVDGLHTFQGASHDLELVAPMLRAGGVVVIDDLWMPDVLDAAERFRLDHPGFDCVDIPSDTKHRVFRKRP